MFVSLTLAAALAGPPSQADLDACAVAQVANSFGGWETYLAAHPEGVCARAPAATDVRACLAARDTRDASEWKAYTVLHPRGFCITEAKGVVHDQQVAATRGPEELGAVPGTVGGVQAAVGTVVVGALSREQVRAVFDNITPSLQGCGDGLAEVRASITPEGRLDTLAITGVEEPVAACLEQAIATAVTFPSGDGPTTFVHRLALTAAE